MRQVFSSARIENVQAVAKLLTDEGIEIRIDNGQHYRRSIRGNFSYRDGASNPPRASVWVLRSDDQPRARQLLRDAGLLEATPANPGSFLPASGHAAKAGGALGSRRLRMGLFLGLAVALAMWLNQFRNPGWELPAPAAPVATPAPLDPSLQAIDAGTGAVHRIPTPPALAAALALAEAARAGDAPLCLSVDGEDPSEATLAAAAEAGTAPLAASACPAGGVRVAVDDYRTDGSGSGTIAVEVRHEGGEPEARRLDVRREGRDWHWSPASP